MASIRSLLLPPDFSATEYSRPWKLTTLTIALALLCLGSFYLPAPDWDIPITFIMGILTYLTAPLSVGILFKRQWRYVPLALFFGWFTVDGCYAIYWYLKDPEVLQAMRLENFKASLPIYGLAGVFWLYQGSVQALGKDLRQLRSRR